ncbi:hypothetical protein MASR2M15_08730 [Anaerolineales bacterium]
MQEHSVRILIISNNNEFAISLRRALDPIHHFEVMLKGSMKHGVRELSAHFYRVVLLDFDTPDVTEKVLGFVKQNYPDIRILIATQDAELRKTIAALGVDGVIRHSIKARQFVDIINGLVFQSDEKQNTPPSKTPSKITKTTRSNPSPSRLFDRLSADEPPLPGIADGATIRDILNASGGQTFEILMPLELPHDLSESQLLDVTPSRRLKVLELMIDDGTPLGTFSISRFVKAINAEEIEQDAIVPLPSWVEERELSRDEPDFLSNVDWPSLNATVMLTNNIDLKERVQQLTNNTESNHPDQEEIIWYDHTRPMESLDEDAISPIKPEIKILAKPEDTALSTTPRSPFTPADERYVQQMAVTLIQFLMDSVAVGTLLVKNNRVIAYEGEMPLEELDALSELIMNDWSAGVDGRMRYFLLPSTGHDYLLFSRRTLGDMTFSVIFPGETTISDMRQQSQVLAQSLEQLLNTNVSDKVKVDLAESDTEEIEISQVDTPSLGIPTPPELPVTQTESVADFEVIDESFEDVDMLDEPSLDEEFEDQPIDPSQLPDLRLSNVSLDEVELEPRTFLWVVDSATNAFDDHLASLLKDQLSSQLLSLGWQIDELAVYMNYVYLYTYAPPVDDLKTQIRELISFSRRVAKLQNEVPEETQLWADGYLVLTPGRPLSEEEIKQFVRFSRSQ